MFDAVQRSDGIGVAVAGRGKGAPLATLFAATLVPAIPASAAPSVAADATKAVPAPPSEPIHDAEAPQRTVVHWYGGYTLLSDGLSILTAPAYVGIGGYFVAS